MASDLTPEEREFLKSLGDTRGYQPVAAEDPDEEAPAPPGLPRRSLPSSTPTRAGDITCRFPALHPLNLDTERHPARFSTA